MNNLKLKELIGAKEIQKHIKNKEDLIFFTIEENNGYMQDAVFIMFQIKRNEIRQNMLFYIKNFKLDDEISVGLETQTNMVKVTKVKKSEITTEEMVDFMKKKKLLLNELKKIVVKNLNENIEKDEKIRLRILTGKIKVKCFKEKIFTSILD